MDEKLWEKATSNQNVSSWADCDTDDDNDFGGSGGLAPLPEDWKGSPKNDGTDGAGDASCSESDSEEEDEEEEDDMVKNDDEEGDEEEEPEVEAAAPVVSKQPAGPERQLSKKEQKQKELEELDAALAELGVDLRDDEASSAGENAGGESKAAAKRRKKAEREAAEAKAGGAKSGGAESEAKASRKDDVEDSSPVEIIDPAEAKRRLAAKMASKKKSSSGGAATAVAEAKARAAKAKKKGSGSKANHNQQPV